MKSKSWINTFMLFNMILEDVNINTIRKDHLREKRLLERQIADQGFYMLRVGKLFLLEKIKCEDFNNTGDDIR